MLFADKIQIFDLDLLVDDLDRQSLSHVLKVYLILISFSTLYPSFLVAYEAIVSTPNPGMFVLKM